MLTVRARRALVGLALPALAAAGCNEFLTDDPRLDRDPNNPTEASIDNLYNAVQVNIGGLLTAELARIVSMWMQQMAGTERQYAGQGQYIVDSDVFEFTQFYSQGGLVDIRRVQAKADSAADQVYGGIARVWEVLLMTTAADMWGDIPYREALDPDIPTANVDPQSQVYADLGLKLDTALTMLASGEGNGPGDLDRVYGGDPALWIEAGNTLKARLLLRQVETAADRNAVYAQVDAAAALGISDPANDFNNYASSTAREQNQWYQFMIEQRAGYIAAGSFLLDLLQSTNDPRLAEYFSTNSEGEFVGTVSGAAAADVSSLSSERIDPAFRQPIITWAENQLIRAEANFFLGGQAAAQPYLDAVRTEAGAPLVPATIENIMSEKYIVNFQNIETWSDWRRTCWPNLPPVVAGEIIPARLFYPASDAQVNPNIPADPVRNETDPPGGVVVPAASCLGSPA
jgi:starch-binding outer membrane protein, SusD/RagB family